MPRQQRVVLVEPDLHWRKNIKATLAKVDYLIIGEAEDGITAIKLIRSRQPDLVITEAFLPGMNGIEVARIVHEDKLAPVVLTSSAYHLDVLEKAKDALVFGFVTKPLDETTLIPAIEIALNTYQELSRLEGEISSLKNTLETRKMVERAKGILMETLGLAEVEAFRRIQKQSMNKRLSMRAVAEAIILAHQLSEG